MTDATLPADAKVVKVATVNGVVTLRGQVDNAADSKAIEAKAKLAAPANRIDNQLTVKAPR
jgi:osmotically-inducible protein OsmY